MDNLLIIIDMKGETQDAPVTEDSNSNKYIQLGNITFKTRKTEWQKVQKYQQETFNKIEPTYCNIKSDLSSLYYRNYFKLQLNGQQITVSHRLNTCLTNLFEKQHVKISNPLVVGTIQQAPYKDNSGYFPNNAEDNMQYEFMVEVWVREALLRTLTRNYAHHQKKIQQKGIAIEQQLQIINDRRIFVYNSQEQQKLSDKTDRQFISILCELKPIFKKQSTSQKQKPKSMMIPLIYDPQNINAKQLAPIIGGDPKFPNVNSKNPTVSFNFNDKNNEVGIFFDLKNDQIQQHPTPNGFNGKLKSFQASALTWMLYREGKDFETGIDMTHVPFWQDKGAFLGLKDKLLYNQSLQYVVWNKNIVKKCNGGILADQMGLGKTIMVIALILAHRPTPNCKTLIVAPLSVIKQWRDQIMKFAPHLTVFVVNQSKINRSKIDEHDIIITTEGKIRADSKRNSEQALIMNYEWFRIVIDEAHNFKNSKTAMAKAVYQLNAQYRWCLTGTPTQNSIGDIFSLVKFLRFTPWCSQVQWESKFPKDSKKTKVEHFKIMKELLKGILLRRKKQSRDENGQMLIDLPNSDVKVHIVQLSQEAKTYYRMMDFRAKNALNSLQEIEKRLKRAKTKSAKKGLNERKKISLNRIFALIMKLRMTCCHEFLINYDPSFVSHDRFLAEYLKFLSKNKVQRFPKYNYFQYFMATSEQKQKLQKQTGNLNLVYEDWDQKVKLICQGYKEQCQLCQFLEEGVITPCLHMFCQKCIDQHIINQWSQYNLQERLQLQRGGIEQKFQKDNLRDFASQCPRCRQELRMREIFRLPTCNQFNRPMSQFQPNEKILALMEYIQKMQSDDKALIFTSFLGMMTLIHKTLNQHKISCLTIKGGDNYESRHEKIEQFNNPNSRIQVMILTLKTGSVGLNMETANKVFFMDPWWNPAIEEQAIGRVHRIGQKKQVEAVKFITESTIQARILKLSLIKKQMSDSVLDIDDVVNDKRYSKSRAEIKFLLSVEESYGNDSEDQNYPKNELVKNTQENLWYQIPSKTEVKRSQQQQQREASRDHSQNWDSGLEEDEL